MANQQTIYRQIKNLNGRHCYYISRGGFAFWNQEHVDNVNRWEKDQIQREIQPEPVLINASIQHTKCCEMVESSYQRDQDSSLLPSGRWIANASKQEYLPFHLRSEVKGHSIMSNSLRSHGLYSPWNSSRPECQSGQPLPSPEDLPNPGIEIRSPALQTDSLAAEPQGKPRGNSKIYQQVDCRSALMGMDRTVGRMFSANVPNIPGPQLPQKALVQPSS